jgi:hypothetical protein
MYARAVRLWQPSTWAVSVSPRSGVVVGRGGRAPRSGVGVNRAVGYTRYHWGVLAAHGSQGLGGGQRRAARPRHG